MKRIVALVLLAIMSSTSLCGCYGKFALTRKIYQVNGQVRDKYLRSALTWVFIIVPVYGVAALADFIAFNTIEFWSGRNPVAEGEKEFQYVEGDTRFAIHARKEGNTVTYVIDHFVGDRHADSMKITWNLSTAESQAVVTERDTITEYVAAIGDDSVQVRQSDPASYGRRQELLAYYRQ
ncbi:hypothetical protein GEOBC_02612 [Geobacteraceae bacterium]|nr:hypothetical protein GEOBC_02612 [Geobacteraceae bacterium]